jgi:hypothetical protein
MKLLVLPLVVLTLVSRTQAADASLTIYNQNFAVIRDIVPLNLQPGENQAQFAEATAHLEPDSVILRDPAGKIAFQILEQNYRNDPISESRLLSLWEGKTIDFLVRAPEKPDRMIQGKIIRSGYVPHSLQAMQMYGRAYYQNQMAMARPEGGGGQPIIEVDGKLHFSLPGQPLFPALGDDTILKPTLQWRIASQGSAKLEAELSYVTGGMMWKADYNVVAPETGDILSLVGWVTIDNQSGKTFSTARIKLIAGDVQKLQSPGGSEAAYAMATADVASREGVTEKAFDEFHLYTLPRPTTLRDRETKQVEFLRAENIQAKRLYIYDGARIDPSRWRGSNHESFRENAEYGTESNPKVWVMSEIKNTEANHLGMALPRGRLRFYRRDGEQLQFTGENRIDHTAKDETLRVYTGNAFDLKGERKRTRFKVNSSEHSAEEAFEIRLRNHKKEPVEIRVVEHLYRGHNWKIGQSSNTWLQTDAETIEFRIPLKPDQEHVLTYDVRYTW